MHIHVFAIVCEKELIQLANDTLHKTTHNHVSIEITKMQGNLNILRNKQFQKPSRVLVVKFLQIYFYLAKSKRNHILFYFTPKLHY